MNEREVVKVEVHLAPTKHESTRLIVERDSSGTFIAEATYLSESVACFPAPESARRAGRVAGMMAEGLIHQIALTCGQGWYHRYPYAMRRPTFEQGYRWLIRLETQDGVYKEWRGTEYAPQNMHKLYEALVAFGMYGVRGMNAYTGDRDRRCLPYYETDDDDVTRELKHILCYEDLFNEGIGTSEDPGEQGVLLADEFCDDVTMYLKRRQPEALTAGALKKAGLMVSDEGRSLTGLCLVDVKKASREQMLCLFGALVQLAEPRSTIAEFVGNGTFTCWCERLRKIPREERDARIRAENQERAQRAHRVDEAIRKRMKSSTSFTSYDVAGDCAVTAQQASARIRAFVRTGDLVPLEGEMPRRYRSAA